VTEPEKETAGNPKIGEGKPGPARPTGIPNKSTTAVREAIALFAEQNVSKLQGWLDKTAEKDPEKAADLFLRAREYFTPKLARTETTVDRELTVATRLVIKRPGDG
jgi:hypothetical protein